MTSSGGALDENEDSDSRSSKSGRGSLTAAASLEACRRPLTAVERSSDRTSLIVIRLNADGISRRAIAANVKAIDSLLVL